MQEIRVDRGAKPRATLVLCAPVNTPSNAPRRACSRVNSQKARGRKSLGALLSADLEHKNLLRLGAGSAAGRREHTTSLPTHVYFLSAPARAHAAIFAQPPAYCAKQRDQTKVIIFCAKGKIRLVEKKV